jgi:hypothetical protein
MCFVKKARMLEILKELERTTAKRDELLLELLSIPVTAGQRRQIVKSMSGGTFIANPEPMPIELPRNFNLMNSIRDLLDSQSNITFSASRIKATLNIPSSAEKSFYAALAKLAGTGQIRRVGRALYQAASPRKTAPKKRRVDGKPRTDSAS